MNTFSKCSLVLLILLVSMSTAHAAALCNASTASSLVLENPRPYNDAGRSFTFYAYYRDAEGNPLQGNNTFVQASINGTVYNMTNLTTRWSLTLTSNLTEDVLVFVNATNDNYACKTTSFVTKWRVPFYVKFQLFKEKINTTDPERYMNDFQYVVLVDNNDQHTLDMTGIAFNNGAIAFSNAITGWLMPAGTSSTISAMPIDNVAYFWGSYDNGEATVKLYEPSNYSVYVMNNKVEYPINFFWEFQRPTTNDPGYLGNVYDNLRVYNDTNLTHTAYTFNNTLYKISLSRFEANAYFAVLNRFYVFLIVVGYIAGLVLVVWVAGNTQNGGQIIIGYILGGGSIALGLIFSIPH